MGKCRRKVPFADFANAGPINEDGTRESKGYIYTPDGLYRIKKSGQMQDIVRRKLDVLLDIRQQTLGY